MWPTSCCHLSRIEAIPARQDRAASNQPLYLVFMWVGTRDRRMLWLIRKGSDEIMNFDAALIKGDEKKSGAVDSFFIEFIYLLEKNFFSNRR